MTAAIRGAVDGAAHSGHDPLFFAKPDITDEDVAAVVAVLRSGWITTGDECAAFEAELAAALDIAHVVAVSSCTAAEEICLASLDLPAGSGVAVPTWTFVSSALAIERVGCTPVLVDVDENSLNMDVDSLARTIDKGGIKAVVGVHYGGTPFPTAIHDLCREARLPLIEDAAHAFGASDHRGMVAGQNTAGACFSFYATKNLTTGEGGAIATDDADLAEFARLYRLHGMSRDAADRYARPGLHSYDVTVPGLKANMSDVLAALGRSQLRRFAASQAHRRSLVRRYRDNLAGVEVRVVPNQLVEGSSDHLMVLDALQRARRDRVIAALAVDSVGTSVHFRPVHTFGWYREHGVTVAPGGLPVADRLDGRIMSLPLHVNMTIDDVDRVSTKLVESL